MSRRNSTTHNVAFGFSLLLASVLCNGCSSSSGGTTTGNPVVSEDSSVSGEAAGSVGGALSTSSTGGTQAFFKPYEPLRRSERPVDLFNVFGISKAWAANLCPTFKTSASSGLCSSGAGTMWLTDSDCSFGSSAAVWNGTQALIMSSGTASCGTFPAPGASQNLVRQFVSAAGSVTPSTLTHTSAYGTVSQIDDATANLGNFDGDTITTIKNSGYGSEISFGASGARTEVTVAHRISATDLFDHSVTGSVSITETAGSTTRTINGTVTVYHNLVRIIGSAVFNNVIHTDQCCLPTSGTITTTFHTGTIATTSLGAKMNGQTETLTFTGCGTGTLTSYDGVTKDVSLSRCY